jgi:hypothetical protein
MTEVLSRFGDVPADFVEAEMRVVKMEQDVLEWLRSTALVPALTPDGAKPVSRLGGSRVDPGEGAQ